MKMIEKLRLLLMVLPAFSFAQWTQIGSTLVGDATGNQFGHSVSLSADGSVMAVGAISNNTGGANAGRTKVFQNNNGTWSQIGADINGAAGDLSGYSVSLSSNGNVLAVGAVGANHVKVYTKTEAGTWVQVGNTINGEASGDQFGFRVDLSDNGAILAVSGRLNDAGGSTAGHVRVYQYNGSAWVQIGADIDGDGDNYRFGTSVSLSSDGTILAVSGLKNSTHTAFGSGQVKVYQNNGGNWQQIGADLIGAPNDRFGSSVSLTSNGNILAVGSGNDGDYAKIYEYDGTTWAQLGNTITSENAGDSCGAVSISADGSTVAVGSQGNDDSGINAGQARVFKNINGTWTQQGSDIEGLANFDGFGGTLALSSDASVLAVGSFENFSNNAGYVMAFSEVTLGLEDHLQNDNFKVYPNPTQHQLHVNSTASIEKIEIYNCLGQKVVTTQETTIFTSGLQNGIYILKLYTEGGNVSVKRFVKE